MIDTRKMVWSGFFACVMVVAIGTSLAAKADDIFSGCVDRDTLIKVIGRLRRFVATQEDIRESLRAGEHWVIDLDEPLCVNSQDQRYTDKNGQKKIFTKEEIDDVGGIELFNPETKLIKKFIGKHIEVTGYVSVPDRGIFASNVLLKPVGGFGDMKVAK